MVERQTRADTTPRSECQVIPFRCANSASWSGYPLIDHASDHAGTRTLRPIDVVLLLPIITPLTLAILLGLLGWFVAWLAIVGLLVTAIVFTDLARAVQWRLYRLPVRSIKVQAIGGR
jgi:hypothetical protein